MVARGLGEFPGAKPFRQENAPGSPQGSGPLTVWISNWSRERRKFHGSAVHDVRRLGKEKNWQAGKL